MFLLVSVRHVGAHPSEHQHGVSIQISISLGKTFLQISRIRNIPPTWMLARVFVYIPPFISQNLDGFDFYFDLFWMGGHWKPAIIHSQGGVVLILQIQPSPLAPRHERRFSFPRKVPSGEKRSRRVRCIGKLGCPGFLNTGETSERFQFARTAPSWATRTTWKVGTQVLFQMPCF